jgi:ribulose-phosphate 3-epimerase
MTEIAISILSSDFLQLKKEIRSIESSGANWIHIDVMDGHFVPNLTFGPDVVNQISQGTSLPLDVHLMMTEPQKYVERFAASRAEIISVHYEACKENLEEVLHLIRRHGCKPGVVINPTTNVQVLEPYLDDLFLVLQMTVEPGFGGQSFIEDTLENIRWLRDMRHQHRYNYKIEVDGGINMKTAEKCIHSGVDMLVIGSYFIHSSNREETIKELKNIV